MSLAWFDPLMFATSCLCGGGLLLSLWLGWACDRPGRARTLIGLVLGVVGLAAGTFAGIAAKAGQPLAIWGSAATVTALYLLLVVFPSTLFAHGLLAIVEWSRHRFVRRTCMFAVLGFCPFFALALVYVQFAPDDMLDEQARLLQPAAMLTEQPDEADSSLTTDLGRPIRILVVAADASTPTPEHLAAQDNVLSRWDLHDTVIYQPLGWQHTNCHGYVFTAGHYWVGGAQVDLILEDNGYHAVSAVRPDDVAVYRDGDGKVMHSGIVRGVGSDGVILVESKWGQGGRFIHRHDRSPYQGTDCAFYRSPRQGHVVHGVYPGTPGQQSAPPSGSQPSPSPAMPSARQVVGL
jgi:hypothetical protein